MKWLERRTKASFECHPDLLVGDFEDAEYDESELELIPELLAAYTGYNSNTEISKIDIK